MTSSARVRPWLLGALLLALTLICYTPSIRGGLVWDDAAHVTQPALRSWAGLVRIWTEPGATQQYYPVLHSAFWIEHRLWGDSTLGYHLANLLEHGLDCWLLALVLSRWARRRAFTLAAAAAAVLLAVHPVGVESVAWISEQKNTLSLLFYLCAGHAYLKFYDERTELDYVAALIAFFLAVGTKSVTATFPAALLVVIWWREGRIAGRRDVLPLAPFFVVGIAGGFTTAWVERHLIGAAGADFALSFGQRCLLAGRIVGFYVQKLFWPVPVEFIYPRWNVSAEAGRWPVWLAAALAVTAALWFVRKRSRGPLAAWLFFVGSLFPALGFFNVYPFRFSYVADHFQYLAALGLFAAAGAGVAWAWERAPGAGRGLIALASAGAVAWLVAQSRHASAAYVGSETLYRTTLALNPDCWMAHSNLGAALDEWGDTAGALAECRAAVRLKPDYAEGHNNLGNALLAAGLGEGAAQTEFRAALKDEPRFPEARLNLANSLARSPGGTQEALDEYGRLLHEHPDFPEAHFCYANTLALLPVSPEVALREYATAIRLRPGYAEAYANLGRLLARQPNGLELALAEYETAIRLNPAEATTHYSYGVLLERVPGRTADAQREYEEALRLNPRYAEADNNLAVLCARKGNYTGARSHWEAALRSNPNFEAARRNLQLLDQR
ncbi:MAG TPA: tetratricopeptide repeat protein [Opitutaceae bacterium]|jgi:tetratricopeptide (TPR) repeat protein